MHNTALFIDGSNLHATSKALGINIDFKLLLEYFTDVGHTRAMYYTAIPGPEEFSAIKPVLDWCAYNGYKVVTKPIKEFTDASGRRKVKGNMDTEIVVDALELCRHYDHCVIFSGDGDFCALVHALHRAGCKVTVVSSLKAGIISDELRRVCDAFIELADIAGKISHVKEKSRYG